MILLLSLTATPAFAHFGTLIPSDDIVSQGENRTLTLQLKFIHPMEMHYMNLAKPKKFGVVTKGRQIDLLETLKAGKGKAIDQKEEYSTWSANYKIKKPGVYQFFMEPTPYWEAAEDCFIIHYTKLAVIAFGEEKGWDKPLGLETEIIPLTRPFGLWTGNIFTGQVFLRGKPVPGAKVEVVSYADL